MFSHFNFYFLFPSNLSQHLVNISYPCLNVSLKSILLQEITMKGKEYTAGTYVTESTISGCAFISFSVCNFLQTLRLFGRTFLTESRVNRELVSNSYHARGNLDLL